LHASLSLASVSGMPRSPTGIVTLRTPQGCCHDCAPTPERLPRRMCGHYSGARVDGGFDSICKAMSCRLECWRHSRESSWLGRRRRESPRRPGDERRSRVGTIPNKQDTVLGIRLGFGLQAPVPLLDAETLFQQAPVGAPLTSRPAMDEPASGSHGWRESRISDSLVLASKEESTQTCSTKPTSQRRD